MSNPLVLFENFLEDGTVALSTGGTAAGFPLTNLVDWRPGTAYRWKASSTAVQTIHLDYGSTVQPTTIAFGGHNLSTIGATWTLYYSDNDADWTSVTNDTPTHDLPALETFTMAAAHRYWEFRITGTLSAAVQIGVLTLGRRLDWTEGVLPDLDPYGAEAVVEDAMSENGSPIGVNVRYRRRTLTMNYSEPGFLVSAFFDPSSGLGWDDDFQPHAIDSGKPFWFAWNIDTDTNGVYLCKTRSVRMPFVGSTLRRSLYAEFEAWREVS